MYIVSLGASGFPTGNATIQRVRFTFRAIKNAGYTPLIMNKKSIQKKVPYKKKVNRFDGLIFLYTSPSIERPDAAIKRNINKFQGYFREFIILYKRRKKIHSSVVYTQYITELFYYRIISRLLGFSLVMQHVEFRSAIAERNSFFTKVNDKLYDTYCHKFCDGIMVISEFLKDNIQSKTKRLPLIKIPAICDFHDFEIIDKAKVDYKYFLFCGTLAYKPVIAFVLSFFEKAKEQQLFDGKLMCILGGDDIDFVSTEKMFQESKYSSDIVLYKNLPYNQIIPFYKSADLLLIPLRDTIQDIARFPHKVSEYTASKRPLISSKIGELKYYFVNNESALLADEYDVDKYVETLIQAKETNLCFDEIGRKGYEVGYRNFHYESNVEKIKDFFSIL